MQHASRIVGFSRHNNVDYTFEFNKSNNVLNLYNHSITSVKDQSSHWLKNYLVDKNFNNDLQLIYGFLPDKTEIMFQTIGIPSCQDGFYSYAVLWYFYYKGYDIKDTKIKRIRLTGPEIDLFYPPYLDDSITKGRGTKYFFIKLSVIPTVKEIGSLIFDGTELKLSLGINISLSFQSNDPIHTDSSMIIDFSKPLPPEAVVKIINSVSSFLSFMVYRRNICFKSITAYTDEKNNDYFPSSDFYIVNPLSEEKNTKYIPRNNITYYDLKEKTSVILDSCLQNKFTMSHYCENNASRTLYSTDRIFNILRSFDKVCRDSFKYSNPNKIAYEKKLKDALDECKVIIEPFIERNFSEKPSKVKKVFKDNVKNIRNNIAHCDPEYDLQNIELKHIIIVEALIYALELKGCGITDEDCQSIIHNLFE